MTPNRNSCNKVLLYSTRRNYIQYPVVTIREKNPKKNIYIYVCVYLKLTLTTINCCSVTKSCPTPCDPMNCSTPGFSWPSLSPRACSKSYPLSQWCCLTISSSVSPFSCSQSFPASGSFPVSHQVAKVLELQLQHQCFQDSGLISFRIDCSDLLAVQGTLSTTIWSISSSALSLLYGPALTPVYDYWKTHSFDYRK